MSAEAADGRRTKGRRHILANVVLGYSLDGTNAENEYSAREASGAAKESEAAEIAA